MCGAAFLCLSGDFFEGGRHYRANHMGELSGETHGLKSGRNTRYITGTLYVIVESFDAAVLPILSPKNALISLLAV